MGTPGRRPLEAGSCTAGGSQAAQKRGLPIKQQMFPAGNIVSPRRVDLQMPIAARQPVTGTGRLPIQGVGPVSRQIEVRFQRAKADHVVALEGVGFFRDHALPV